MWLFHPQTLGAAVVYDNVVYPVWKEHEGKIEEVTKRIEGVVEKVGQKVIKEAKLNETESKHKFE